MGFWFGSNFPSFFVYFVGFIRDWVILSKRSNDSLNLPDAAASTALRYCRICARSFPNALLRSLNNFPFTQQNLAQGQFTRTRFVADVVTPSGEINQFRH